MSAKNDPPNNEAEIGEALVAALGFEPTDSKKLGRSPSRVANGSSGTASSDGKESASDTIGNGDSADGTPVAKANESESESKNPSGSKAGNASRSSSKSRSRKKSKRATSGANTSKKTSTSTSTSKSQSPSQATETQDSQTPGDEQSAVGRAKNEATKGRAAKGRAAKGRAAKGRVAKGNGKNETAKNDTAGSEDGTSPADMASRTSRISTSPAPPNEDSIRTPGVGESDDEGKSSAADSKDKASGEKSGNDKVAGSKSTEANPTGKQGNSSAANKRAGKSVASKAKVANKAVAEQTKPQPKPVAEVTPMVSPVVNKAAADTEVLPQTVPATVETNSPVPVEPATTPVPAASEAAVAPAESRSLTKPAVSGSSLFGGRRKVQARKVRRVVRHIDPWSVLIFSVIFHLCVAAALLIASVLVWNAAEAAGTITMIEEFIRDLGDFQTFVIDGEAIFRAAVGIAGVLVLASSVLLVLLTVMFNLISDLVGGIRITVIEEETVRVKRK